MSFSPPWDDTQEPSQHNVKQLLENLYSEFTPIEQAKWNQSNFNSLSYAEAQNFVNNFYGSTYNAQYQNYYFNLLQSPVNMETSYQRQNRKAIAYVPTENSDEHITDQYTKLMTHVCESGEMHEVFSKACELAAVIVAYT